MPVYCDPDVIPEFHDPVLSRRGRAYFHLTTTLGETLFVHGGQLRLFVQYDKALREGNIPPQPPIGYDDFSFAYNTHRSATEKWATLDSDGTIRILGEPITSNRFPVEDGHLVNVREIVPPGQYLSKTEAEVHRALMVRSVQKQERDSAFARERREKQKERYIGMDDGPGGGRNRKLPKKQRIGGEKNGADNRMVLDDDLPLAGTSQPVTPVAATNPVTTPTSETPAKKRKTREKEKAPAATEPVPAST